MQKTNRSKRQKVKVKKIKWKLYHLSIPLFSLLFLNHLLSEFANYYAICDSKKNIVKIHKSTIESGKKTLEIWSDDEVTKELIKKYEKELKQAKQDYENECSFHNFIDN